MSESNSMRSGRNGTPLYKVLLLYVTQHILLIEKAWRWHKDRYVWANGMEDRAQARSHTHAEGAKSTLRRRDGFLNNWCWDS